MARILITSGPTRQFLDPVRYLSNASSGRMGQALATAALERGHEVIVISGPVQVEYPAAAKVVNVITTDELLAACQLAFPKVDGLIGAAAPCDYRPRSISADKLSKTGDSLRLELVETPDVVATLACKKRSDQWVVGFALETSDARFRALAKLERKCCDLIVLNGPAAMNSTENSVEVFDVSGERVGQFQGPKLLVARGILRVIDERLPVPSDPSHPTTK